MTHNDFNLLKLIALICLAYITASKLAEAFTYDGIPYNPKRKRALFLGCLAITIFGAIIALRW